MRAMRGARRVSTWSAVQRFLFGRPVASGAIAAVMPELPLRINSAEGSRLIGGEVYPMAAALCRHLAEARHAHALASGVDVLELGSGTGAVGLFAAGLGARVTLSDKEVARFALEPVAYATDGSIELADGTSDALLRNLRRNVAANRELLRHEPHVAELDWTDAEQVARAVRESPTGEGFALVLGSDVTYEIATHTYLARTISSLLRRRGAEIGKSAAAADREASREGGAAGAGGVALLAHEQRRTSLSGADPQLESFVAAARDAGLQVGCSELAGVQEGSTGTLLELSWP